MGDNGSWVTPCSITLGPHRGFYDVPSRKASTSKRDRRILGSERLSQRAQMGFIRNKTGVIQGLDTPVPQPPIR